MRNKLKANLRIRQSPFNNNAIYFNIHLVKTDLAGSGACPETGENMPTSNTPRTRGRPVRSEQQVADIKARIADHALRLFQKDGYEAISMRRLALEAGCTVMTIYRYYERKIDILRDLWARVFDVLFDSLDQIAELHPDPIKRLEAVALGYVSFWLEHRDHYFMVFMSSNVEQSDVSIFVQNDALVGRFQIFQRGLAEASVGGLSEAYLKVKSEVLLCALNGITQNLITISAYPWSNPKALVNVAISCVIGTKAEL
jgi:AcrR family transcriptional regulator